MAAGTIFDILTKLNTAKNYAEVQPIIADLMEKVSAMHRDNQLLADENAKLKAKIAEGEDFRAQAEGYRTNNEDTGVVTYVLKAPTDSQQQAHRFCPNCFLSAKIRYLQPTKDTQLITHLGGWFRVHMCLGCDKTLTFGLTDRYNPPRQMSDGDYNPYF